jgi:drug/metabolite transporter (DMT)-like permease
VSVPRPPSDPSPARSDARIWVFFGSLALAWGSSFVFIKIALDEGLPPLTLVTFRLLIATALLLVLLRLSGGRLPRSREALGRAARLSLLNVAIPFVLIAWGAQHIPSAVAAIVNGTVPLFSIVLAALILHDEPITLNRLGGLALGFAGAVVLASPNLGVAQEGTDSTLALLGELAVLAGSLSYALGAVYARHAITGRPLIDDPVAGRRVGTPLEIAAVQSILALPMVAVLALLLERPPGGILMLPPSAAAWASVAWLGIVGSAIAYLFFFRIVRAWGATRTTMVTYVIPVVGIVLGVLILGETLHPEEVVGAALVIAGVVLANAAIGRRRLYGRASTP